MRLYLPIMTLPLEQQRRYTVEEYLRLESESLERHEYWDGFIVPLSRLIAMAGGTYEHSVIGANFSAALISRLKGGPCRVMGPDMRVKVGRSRLYFYPDTSVVCAEPQFDPQSETRTTLLNPRVIVEVLSPSTEAYDRGKKLVKYLQIETLEQYVLISQSEPRVDTYYRHTDGSWTFSIASGIDDAVTLRSLGVEVPLREIYSGIGFPPESAPASS